MHLYVIRLSFYALVKLPPLLNTHRDLCCLSSASTTTAESTGYNTPTETVSAQ
jgi:hypothetical protein